MKGFFFLASVFGELFFFITFLHDGNININTGNKHISLFNFMRESKYIS